MGRDMSVLGSIERLICASGEIKVKNSVIKEIEGTRMKGFA
jgi:hypothetical protein